MIGEERRMAAQVFADLLGAEFVAGGIHRLRNRRIVVNRGHVSASHESPATNLIRE
jgi:hypothetical protein